MKRMIKNSWIVFLALVVALGCKQDEPDGPPTALENEINSFIWDGLNGWYFWQNQVANLQDDRFNSLDEKNQFLNQYASPAELFDILLWENDRFSWIVDDYVALRNSFQGVSRSYGFEYNLIRLQDTDSILGYVTYTHPSTSAETQGIRRGDVFYGIDGIAFNLDNYSVLLSQESITLNFADNNSGSWQDNGRAVSLASVNIAENAVHKTQVIDLDGTKVGYISYNQFVYTQHRALNAAFGELVAAGATELVLDLRYNPGGSVFTALLLGGMVYREGTDNTVFSKLVYNAKKSQRNIDFPFLTELSVLDADFNITSTEQMNRLSLNRVYILTGRRTASASELIINGLEPYMEVIQIGTYTRGKNEGSVTLYDSPTSDFRDVATANPQHLWAMQPIVSKIANATGFGSYEDGLAPDYEIDEVSFFDQLLPLGDPEEQLLKIALDDIAGISGIGRGEVIRSAHEDLGGSPHKEQVSRSPSLDGLGIR